MRRVTTGYDSNSRATIVSDEPIDIIQEPSRPGFAMHNVWGADHTLSYPEDGRIPVPAAQFPSAGGVRVTVVTFPPGHGISKKPGGLGMHATDTTDVTLVLAGKAELEMGDGSVVELNTGDTLVQHGTLHEWRNPYDEPCVLAVTLVGAQRKLDHHAP